MVGWGIDISLGEVVFRGSGREDGCQGVASGDEPLKRECISVPCREDSPLVPAALTYRIAFAKCEGRKLCLELIYVTKLCFLETD